jgi:hypothetical protein
LGGTASELVNCVPAPVTLTTALPSIVEDACVDHDSRICSSPVRVEGFISTVVDDSFVSLPPPALITDIRRNYSVGSSGLEDDGSRVMTTMSERNTRGISEVCEGQLEVYPRRRRGEN